MPWHRVTGSAGAARYHWHVDFSRCHGIGPQTRLQVWSLRSRLAITRRIPLGDRSAPIAAGYRIGRGGERLEGMRILDAVRAQTPVGDVKRFPVGATSCYLPPLRATRYELPLPQCRHPFDLAVDHGGVCRLQYFPPAYWRSLLKGALPSTATTYSCRHRHSRDSAVYH